MKPCRLLCQVILPYSHPYEVAGTGVRPQIVRCRADPSGRWAESAKRDQIGVCYGVISRWGSQPGSSLAHGTFQLCILSIKLITWVGVPRHMSSLDSIPGVKSHLNCGNLAPDNEDIDAILVANVNSGEIIKTPAVNRSAQNSKADKRFIWHVLHATKTLISYQVL